MNEGEEMKTKKIHITASNDWSLRYGMMEFVKFLNLTIKHQGEEYTIEFGRVIAEPLRCGDNLSSMTDCIVDRPVDWTDYYKCWGQQALNSQVKMTNHNNMFAIYDKHSTYDLMARLILPEDHFPTTVLFPVFEPLTEDQRVREYWKTEQMYVMDHTRYGWDPNRKEIDWEKVQEKMAEYERLEEKRAEVKKFFSPDYNYIVEAMEEYFDNTFPVFLKTHFIGGGRNVSKISGLQELYKKYNDPGGRAFYLQEAIEDYDLIIRCMAVGPQVLPMKYESDTPPHQRYSLEKLKVDKAMFCRLENYVLFINAYHHWTYNSSEVLVKGTRMFPVDLANACPDSHFTSLHVHFPWLINALVKWLTFCAVAEMNMRIDLEQGKYLPILNDERHGRQEKYQQVTAISRRYFQIDKFEEFCEENFKDLDDQMIAFYNVKGEDLIRYAISMSDFPKEKHEFFFRYYKNVMNKYFRKNAKEYLTTVITT